MIPIQIDENSAEPLYHQIESQLRSLIIGGSITEGTLLPSIREMAGNLKCSVITVRRVYQDLENEGLLRTRQGTGTFVTHVGTEAREEYRTETVRKALETAVEAARSVQMGAEEVENLFRQTLERQYGMDGGDHS
ncbi:GntR family transcriptional regulator [Paenibacillus glufosinatiresistens]|uniref:GntR family transcriptional regulator n=1 Tax=Paenibacillus glufosinatiresistens TaxID=3070657 RepID=UPI00286E467D|nr:GntR family transcriptional regulator [Paenibacillus sp. YX.27]